MQTPRKRASEHSLLHRGSTPALSADWGRGSAQCDMQLTTSQRRLMDSPMEHIRHHVLYPRSQTDRGKRREPPTTVLDGPFTRRRGETREADHHSVDAACTVTAALESKSNKLQPNHTRNLVGVVGPHLRTFSPSSAVPSRRIASAAAGSITTTTGTAPRISLTPPKAVSRLSHAIPVHWQAPAACHPLQQVQPCLCSQATTSQAQHCTHGTRCVPCGCGAAAGKWCRSALTCGTWFCRSFSIS